ncbi:MAG: AraC family transcriptional regulator [Bacteroidota bacterium]|nr:AraC family transcriptional regulator [Bacteroidota bacterium]MDP4216328.1 AraC family transcriptional regulator [Bacteroidota bacterium]MDP4247509.1 AraC family transcriptional regulator [Bacteroidota bacterium]MDP4255057.1 AraC family transcriptional regulator [Bacteroidota bacterium]MDP4257179.1 AraC family transcriptional regulator [Bacteroidota bacterium]
MEVIDNILHYIQSHFDQDLPLETLAEQAHYSPYHFHRLFKQQVGEAPKQYLLRLRLERALKELIFYPQKSVYAIAVDSGFNSQSAFARAFKNKYGIPAEQYRERAVKTIRERTDTITPDVQQFPISVSRLERFYIASELTFLTQEEEIMRKFKELHTWASVRELTGKEPEFYGVFIDSPLSTPLPKCRYLAGIRIRESVSGKGCQTLGGFTVAQIPVMGNSEVSTSYALYVKQRWMNDSGYEIIQGISGFERFVQMDYSRSYSQQHRTIYIGIQPK